MNGCREGVLVTPRTGRCGPGPSAGGRGRRVRDPLLLRSTARCSHARNCGKTPGSSTPLDRRAESNSAAGSKNTCRPCRGGGFPGGSQSIRGDGRNEITGMPCSSMAEHRWRAGGLGPGTVRGPVRRAAKAALRSSNPPEATGRRPSRTRAAFQAVPASVRHAEVCASVEKECHLRDRGLRTYRVPFGERFGARVRTPARHRDARIERCPVHDGVGLGGNG